MTGRGTDEFPPVCVRVLGLGFLGLRVVLRASAPPAESMAGGAMTLDAGDSGMGGFKGEPSHAGCIPGRERGTTWGHKVGLWGLTPPADGSAGGVDLLCVNFLDVGGSTS